MECALRPLPPRHAVGRDVRLMPEWKLIRKYALGGASVLDAACGTGDWATLMTRSGRSVVGLDYSADIVRRLDIHYRIRRGNAATSARSHSAIGSSTQ